jgi:hypothetical protein
MAGFKNRLESIEERLRLERDSPSYEDDCSACAWFADILLALDSGGELPPKDQAIWNDIFENRVNATKAWKKGQAQTIGGASL